VTRLIDRLESKGLVERERDKGDRRVVHCRVTSAGLVVLGALDPAVDRLDEELLGCLSVAEVVTLTGLLNKVRLSTAPHRCA
jgi:DNA-binding MarR family transcriptional regulator